MRDRLPKAIIGPARKGKKTKLLVEHLQPGDIAVIDHKDLDELAAASLCKQKISAVINVDSSMTGRYPNNGPGRLAEAKVIHLDQLGSELFDQIEEGELLTIRGDGVYRQDQLLARGRVMSESLILKQMAVAEDNLNEMLDDFVQNTLDYALKEKSLILGVLDFPQLRTDFLNRQALVVVRGQSYREDLQAIKHYVDEMKPVLIGVDGGADALIEFGYTPDLVVGDMDSVSDQALMRAREKIGRAHV